MQRISSCCPLSPELSVYFVHQIDNNQRKSLGEWRALRPKSLPIALAGIRAAENDLLGRVRRITSLFV